jgi:hypothetical protein
MLVDGPAYDDIVKLLLVPLIGPFHLRSPNYNAVHVRDIVARWAPDVLATTALSHEELATPAWQDTSEIALPLAVAPWAKRSGLRLAGLAEPSIDPAAEEDFRRYIEPYPDMRRRLAEVDALRQPIADLVAESLDAPHILDSLLPAIARYQGSLEDAFGDGPATGWLRSRMRASAERALSVDARRLALLAPVEHLPLLRDLLDADGPELDDLPVAEPTAESRERALLDYAFRTEVADPARLIAQLRELPGAEARFHEANLLLAGGHGFEALELIESTSHRDFSAPYFLPGYLLARLGQLRDLASRRGDALRAYRGVLALDYAPAEALEAAREGLERPFEP